MSRSFAAPLFATVCGFATLASAAFAEEGELVSVDAKYLFAPIGFDDNDSSVVVVDGYLPSGCYRTAQPEVTIDQATKKIAIKPMARYFDVPCIEALVPYHFDVELGVLSEGAYAVEVEGAAARITEAMPVTEATSAGPDDYLYAPVDEVTVKEDRQTGELTATIKGRFTSRCFTWSNVRVQDNGATVNLLPIVAQADGVDCTDGVETPFEKTVQLPSTITRGRHLLHVRSLNGRAVNHIFHRTVQ